VGEWEGGRVGEVGRVKGGKFGVWGFRFGV